MGWEMVLLFAFFFFPFRGREVLLICLYLYTTFKVLFKIIFCFASEV